MKTLKTHYAISVVKILCGQAIWSQSAFDAKKVTCKKCKKKIKSN